MTQRKKDSKEKVKFLESIKSQNGGLKTQKSYDIN
jgi:hypothetical protein